jgi:PAS domain S-box-containing protein
VDCSDDAIVSKTLDGIITSWNRAAERLFGWTAGEAIGQHITLIVPKDLREEEAEVLAALRRGERVEHFETVRLTKDGRRVDMSITVSPIQDASGPIVGASTVARDISEKRRLDDQRALMLEREHEARQQAEALNRAKDEWLATVSHELRTPLNAIFGWARLLKDGALDEAGRTRAIETILRSASAQSRLVDELLDLARIGAGRMRFDLEPVDLNAIIEAALETVRPAAQAKNIDLIASLDGSIGSILGAPDRLQQVVWNLAMNSIKFTPSGGRVSISSRREAALVRIVVADTGQGIDGRVLPHVFEPFRQADSSITRIHGDLGLGLSLVRRLVEAHGGMVVAHSDGVDRGSTFAVTLPLPLADRELDARDEIRGLIDRDPGMAHLQSIRALVVDGDADFLEQLASSLRRAGANVRAVASAAAAHALARSWSPQVVVIDLAMPGEDGLVVARTLRRILTRRGPIVAITAYKTSDGRRRAAHADFDLYLAKPVDVAELTAAVVEVARQKA